MFFVYPFSKLFPTPRLFPDSVENFHLVETVCKTDKWRVVKGNFYIQTHYWIKLPSRFKKFVHICLKDARYFKIYFDRVVYFSNTHKCLNKLCKVCLFLWYLFSCLVMFSTILAPLFEFLFARGCLILSSNARKNYLQLLGRREYFAPHQFF